MIRALISLFRKFHKDMREVETSRSGAAFIAISDWVLEHGGVVYGAGYAEHFRVVHKRAAHYETFNFVNSGKVVFKYLFYQHTVFRKSCEICLPC